MWSFEIEEKTLIRLSLSFFKTNELISSNDNDCLEKGSGKLGIGWVFDKTSPIKFDLDGTSVSIILCKGFPVILFNKYIYPDLVTWAKEGITESFIE